jgi:serine/threonine protein kinase/Flp pilus assembly protein TadD
MSDYPGATPGDRIDQLLQRARGLPPDERASFLDAETAGDAALRAQVEAMLAEESRTRNMAETMDPSTAVKDGVTTRVSAPKTHTEAKQIGQFKLLEVLGEGGFGTVWVAEQQAPIRRRVALKIIKPGMDSRAVIARFEQERQALAIMDHANIAKVFDAGTAPDGRPYFVMEYVPGEPITAYCDKNRLSMRQRLELFIPVCEAVQHAHHKGIIHRDIKPSNVLVSVSTGAGPTIKVIDFGVAKALSHAFTDKTIFTEHGQILGTPEYMSPEQAEMGAMDIDTRTDVYSLGVLLYEILAGALPFEARELRSKGYNEIQRIIREVDPPRPSTRLRSMDGQRSTDVARRRQLKLEELEGQLRRELEWIPLKAMRKDRRERYATPIALADDIRNHLAGRPLTAGPESAIYRAKKFVRRNRASVLAASLVAAALVAGAIVSTIGFVQASRNLKLAILRQQNLEDTNNFMGAMLSSANVASGHSKDVTVRQILDSAVSQLDAGAYQNQPRVEATLRAMLGRTYRSLSEWRDAEKQWRKALELESANAGGQTPEATIALAGLGQLQVDTGRLEEAEKSLTDALALQRKVLPADHADIADTINALGLLADMRGDFKTAETRYREALKMYQANPGVGTRVADAMTNLAGILNKLGNNREAVSLTQQALDVRRQKYGPRSFEVWNSLVNLAALKEADADVRGAVQAGRDAMAIARELFDDKNRNMTVTLTNLAHALWLTGTPQALEEAQSLQSQALHMAEAIDGGQGLGVAQSLDLLACIARDRGDFPGAVKLFRQELAIRTATQPPEHADVGTAMSQLADALSRAGEAPQEAIDLAQRALALRKKVFGADHWAVWSTTSVLGAAYASAGQFDKAEPLLLDSFKGLESGSAIGNRPRIDAAARLVNLYEKWGKADRAQQWKLKQAQLSPAST